MTGKIYVNLILLMSMVSIVISCLVTNCPRGGKRGKPEFRQLSNDGISSEIRKCRLCSPRKGNCLGINCDSKFLCENEKHCATQNICCSERLCEFKKSHEWDFNLREPKEFQQNSLLLTKILRYNL